VALLKIEHTCVIGILYLLLLIAIFCGHKTLNFFFFFLVFFMQD
jgi:hypothetical protein